MNAATPVPADGDRHSPGERIPFGPRAVTFAVTWIAYFTYYLGRKGVGVVKSSIAADIGESSLYGVETGLLAAYAIGQSLSGYLGDRLGPRRLLTAGLLLSAAACLWFGLSSVGAVLLVAYVVNGFAQSTGWPGTNKAMSEWTTPQDRGRIMGLWATCYQVGGAAATAICARLLRAYGWRWAFIGPAFALAAVAVLVALTLRPGPMSPRRSASRGAPSDELVRTRRAEQRRVLRSVTIHSYGAAYFSIKLVRYSLLFWLTWYLERSLGYEKVLAADVSTAFEFGGFFGTLFLGYVSDRYRGVPRALFAAVSLVLLAGALLLYSRLGALSVALNVILLAAVGFLLFGPDALISGCAAQDAGGPYAAGFAVGVVNGIGSIGAIFQEIVTREVSTRYGWSSLFLVFVGLALLAALCLTPALRARVTSRAA